MTIDYDLMVREGLHASFDNDPIAGAAAYLPISAPGHYPTNIELVHLYKAAFEHLLMAVLLLSEMGDEPVPRERTIEALCNTIEGMR